ncbi:hypothetical protein [Mesorhizobium sp. M0227]|uniref:hypothetical protein n=1 Tax=unclassified Mesorhizobium TaxID=325217 RepID=UPI00333BCD6B
MMPDLSCCRPRVSGKALSMVQKENGSGSLGLTEPFHRNFPEYSNLRGFFTPKNRFCKNHPRIHQPGAVNETGATKKAAAIARGRFKEPWNLFSFS